MNKLFVVGFAKDMDELQLLEMFSIHGSVDFVKIITDQDTHQSRGYGFVTMVDRFGAERAITALNGSSVAGRTLTARTAEGRGESPGRQNSAGDGGAGGRRNTESQRETGRIRERERSKRPRRPL